MIKGCCGSQQGLGRASSGEIEESRATPHLQGLDVLLQDNPGHLALQMPAPLGTGKIGLEASAELSGHTLWSLACHTLSTLLAGAPVSFLLLE